MVNVGKGGVIGATASKIVVQISCAAQFAAFTATQ